MKRINIGIIGLGLMGREFASATSRWCHFTDDISKPIIKGICNKNLKAAIPWFQKNFSDIEIVTNDYKELISLELIKKRMKIL